MPEERLAIRVITVLGWEGLPEGLPRSWARGVALDLEKGDGGGYRESR